MLVDIEKSDAGTESQWLAESGIVDLFILLGPSPPQAGFMMSPECCILILSSRQTGVPQGSGEDGRAYDRKAATIVKPLVVFATGLEAV